MGAIVENQTIQKELVLSERVVTNEFRIINIQENVKQRQVQVEVEFGPFTSVTMPNGDVEVRGGTRHSMTVWQGEEYDAVRDTWGNTELLAAVTAALSV